MQKKSSGARRLSRRHFLGAGAAAAAFSIAPRHILGGLGFTPPSEVLNVAIIGTGGRGKNLFEGVSRYDDVRVVAIADPCDRENYDRFYYRGVSGRLPVKELLTKHYSERKGISGYECRDYKDYREMLDKEKGIDAVMIATPDHVHAVATLAAMRLGKHVYCEKPLTHTVEEARKVAEEARKSKVATQMGNQGNSSEGIRQVIEWVRAGVIGEVRELHAWSDAGGWAEGRTSAPKDSPPVPQGLDWDLWLGPVKPRAYHPAYAPYNWRGWWAFGGGAIGDMGCHNIDPAFAALELGSPDTIEASGVGRNPETSGWGSIIHYTFPARGEMPPVKLTWYDGGLKPPRPEEFAPGERFDGNGLLLVGSKGKLLCGGWSRDPRLLPASRMKEFEPPPKTLPRVSAHDRAWIDACKGGPKPSSSFEYGGALTEVVLLGAVALQVGEKIHWDGPNLRATNSGKVEELIRTEYRKGWSL